MFEQIPDEMPRFALLLDGEQIGWARAWDQWTALSEFNEWAPNQADDVKEIH